MVLMTGCKGLDYSARGEGTGVQIIGAIVVLAKYHASQHQKEVAEQKARAAYVAVAKPAYEKRRATVKQESGKRIARAERDYTKRIAQARSQTPAVAAPGKIAAASQIEQEKEQALEKLRAEAAAELASVDTAYRSLGGTTDHSAGSADVTPTASIPGASTRDREALVASASAHLPAYIAVPVPAQGIGAEQGGKAIVMLWDTRRQRLASDQVLVLDRRPAVGTDAKVDGMTARFAVN
jgi:transketolase